jgi:CO/xanthine dehydrogenase FAD-binding subunit
VAPIPIRLPDLERELKGKSVNAELVQLAKTMAGAAIQPIDDIRSTANYRAAVAGNLIAEFLEQLGRPRPGGKTEDR